MACRLHKKDEADCLTVELLRDAGALPLCRGNVMQVMMLAESVNRIWGRTRNPWNLDRSPGGSSGGDAALVAMGCVPLSACADGAGSIRIPGKCSIIVRPTGRWAAFVCSLLCISAKLPASFCGVVGFKPTTTRGTYRGCMRPRVVSYTLPTDFMFVF
jgi:Asp-tRNA(Asn)/Glu-tRNA(Gln) amidotransferase A subunit family amidase